MIYHFTPHTINCVCLRIRSMFRVLGMYNFASWFNLKFKDNMEKWKLINLTATCNNERESVFCLLSKPIFKLLYGLDIGIVFKNYAID